MLLVAGFEKDRNFIGGTILTNDYFVNKRLKVALFVTVSGSK